MSPDSQSTVEDHEKPEMIDKSHYQVKIAWRNVFLISFLHLASIYALYLTFTLGLWKTFLFGITYNTLGGIGITAGNHRLWAHRSYKAKWPLRVLLCVMASIGAQQDIYVWCRDHRVHHKFAETDADPHNIKRGFFFAHVGWLMCRKHPEVTEKGNTLDFSDLWADPIVRFHKRYYYPMATLFCFIIPTVIPAWFWGESYWNAYFVCGLFRYCFMSNVTWLVNSAAHRYGSQPFDTRLEARDNSYLAVIQSGEGWHNYHHAFPWDYAASELGNTGNLTKRFIDLMALIGWAYDLKKADLNSIKQRKLKTGDGSRLETKDIEEYVLKLQKTM